MVDRFSNPKSITGVPERILHEVTSFKRPLIAKPWLQLVLGLFLCAILPYLIRHGVQINPEEPSGLNTMYAGSLAFLTSYILHRQLGNFPGVRSAAYTLVAASVPFATIAIIFLMLRLEYSRFVLSVSFIATFVWLSALKFFTRRMVVPDIAVVPGGFASVVTRIPNIRWKTLSQPPDSMNGITAVVADLRHVFSHEWENFLARCTLAGIPVYNHKQLIESLTGKVEIDHMSETSYGTLLPNSAYLTAKKVIDWVAALLLLPFFLIAYAFIAPIIIWHSGFPAIFVQERVGYRGRMFKMYKFRTMKNPSTSPPKSEAEFAMTKDRDERITPIGRLLRKYRIDETPQIFNILQGEMSWIGPRPEAASLSRWYEKELAFYPYRHVVRPGITGWAQINQGHVTSTDAVLEKLHFDFFYIKYLSPWLDLLICIRTVKAVFNGIGAR